MWSLGVANSMQKPNFKGNFGTPNQVGYQEMGYFGKWQIQGFRRKTYMLHPQ